MSDAGADSDYGKEWGGQEETRKRNLEKKMLTQHLQDKDRESMEELKDTGGRTEREGEHQTRHV